MDRKSKKQTEKAISSFSTEGPILKAFTSDCFSDMEQDEGFENVDYLLFSNHREYESAIA
jgi:hypothetical protein